MASRRKFSRATSRADRLTAKCSIAHVYLSNATVEFRSSHSVDKIQLKVATLSGPMALSRLRGRSATPSSFCTAETTQSPKNQQIDRFKQLLGDFTPLKHHPLVAFDLDAHSAF